VAPRSTRDIPDEAKLFVAGLPPTMTNELLLSIFSPYGEVRPSMCIVSSSSVADRSANSSAELRVVATPSDEVRGLWRLCCIRLTIRSDDSAYNLYGVYPCMLPALMLCCAKFKRHLIMDQVLDARAIGAHLGPCKGYGFVTMASVDAAAAAIRCLSMNSVPHCMIKVQQGRLMQHLGFCARGVAYRMHLSSPEHLCGGLTPVLLVCPHKIATECSEVSPPATYAEGMNAALSFYWLRRIWPVPAQGRGRVQDGRQGAVGAGVQQDRYPRRVFESRRPGRSATALLAIASAEWQARR